MNSQLTSLINRVSPNIIHDEDITDNFFVAVENNPTLLNEYNALCNLSGQITINQKLGKMIKDIFGLENTGRNKYPKSSLIKSYTIH